MFRNLCKNYSRRGLYANPLLSLEVMVIITNLYYFLTTGKISDLQLKLNSKFIFSYISLKISIIILFLLVKIIFFGLGVTYRNEVFENPNFLKLFLNILIIAPLFEEMICRYHLNFSKKSIFISSIFACVFLYDELTLLFIILIYLGLLVFMIVKNLRFNRLTFVYLSSFIFACSHLISYPQILVNRNLIEAVFVIGPHFFGGLLLSYVFFRNGIIASIALHSLWNLIPYSIHVFKLAVLGEE